MNLFAERYFSMKDTNPDIAEGMPNDAETALYNTLYTYKERNEEVFAKLDRLVWTNFFNYRIDEYEPNRFGLCIFDEGFRGNCILKFAIIDFLLHEIENLRRTTGKEIPSFSQELNEGFERVRYGYRIINNHVTPITSPKEIEEIEKAIRCVPDNVKEHFNRAIQHLSNKQNPDYRNSVKESISAVEAFCERYTKESTLTSALVKIDKRKVLTKNLVDAFKNLYNYTSEKETGARHGWAIDDNKSVPTYYEARFMLVACSAFINYIKGKFSENLGIIE